MTAKTALLYSVGLGTVDDKLGVTLTVHSEDGRSSTVYMTHLGCTGLINMLLMAASELKAQTEENNG